jgi:hypothetical protein
VSNKQTPRDGRDPDTHRGVKSSLARAFNCPLLLDTAAEAAFASSIARLRGERGTNQGGNQ